MLWASGVRDRRRAAEHDARQGHQPEPGRLRRVRPVDPGSGRRCAGAGRRRRRCGRQRDARRRRLRARQLQRRRSPSARTRRAGDSTSYSNFGRRIDLTAPGGDLPLTGPHRLAVATTAATVPGGADLRTMAEGTSFAAPHGVGHRGADARTRSAAHRRTRARSPHRHDARLPERVAVQLDANLCGAGMLDAGAAIGSTIPGGVAAAQRVSAWSSTTARTSTTTSSRPIRPRSHYIDTFLGGIFQRTGLYFYAYLDPCGRAAGRAAGVPLLRERRACRSIRTGTRRTSTSACSCCFNWPGIWNLETADGVLDPGARRRTASARRRRCRCTASSTTGATRITATRWTSRCAAR